MSKVVLNATHTETHPTLDSLKPGTVFTFVDEERKDVGVKPPAVYIKARPTTRDGVADALNNCNPSDECNAFLICEGIIRQRHKNLRVRPLKDGETVTLSA